ncbi:MAG: Sec-independent protein translocase protein TatB [Sphingomonas bacterium]|nr:Sec-independent protein translocase protein TatB [Sphingomonas bacterium]
MLDIAPTELLLVAFVALVVIGPKDLPKAMRIVGYWVGKARGVGRQFRSGFDAMVREAELDEMEKKWAAENERIMREHPSHDATQETTNAAAAGDADVQSSLPLDDDMPVMVEKPRVQPAPDSLDVDSSADDQSKASS